jgi:hypothetical protein
MAYIGREPQIGNFQVCDAITVVNNQAAYTMQVASVNVSPESANHMLVSLNGILQAPTSSFTVSGSTITFASNLVTGDVIDFIQILGNVLDLGVPSDNTVTTAKLSDSSVTTAKLNDASVSLAKLTATGTKNATTFLRGDNTFDTPPLGGITEADQWRLTADKTNVSSAETIDSNWERNDTVFDKIGTGMSESSGIFSFPSTGIWYVSFNAMATSAASDYISAKVKVTTNNSSYTVRAESYQNTAAAQDWVGISTNVMVDVSDTSNVKVLFEVDSDSAINYKGSTNANYTWSNFIRLGDT